MADNPIISIDVVDLGPNETRKFKVEGKKGGVVIGGRNKSKKKKTSKPKKTVEAYIPSYRVNSDHFEDPNRIIRIKKEPVTLQVPDIVVEKTRLDFDPNNWIKFGSDNLFPNALAAINRQAINQRSVLHWKAIYTTGNGFLNPDDESLLEYFKRVNPKGQTFRKVFKKTIQSFNASGNAYVEIVTDTFGTFTWLFVWDNTKVRLGKRSRRGFAGMFPDWARVHGREADIKWVPLYPNFEPGDDGLLHSILHIKEDEDEFPNYGLPVWVAALDAAAIGYKTNKWNLTRLDNQFQTSGILELYGSKDDKELKEGIEKFKKARIGEKRNSQLLIIVKERGNDDASKYTPLIQTNDGDWIKLHDQSDQDIIIANNWFRSLSGLSEPGKLGSDTQQIRTQYDIALSTVITETQDLILEALKPIFQDVGGFNVDSLEVINQSPVGIADRLNPNFILTRKEGYEIFGLTPDENDPDLNKVINTNKGKVEEIKLEEDATRSTD